MAVIFLTAQTPRVQALVEEGWPDGTPNTCQNADDFFLDFETGIDEIEIESTIPSMQFTSTGALNWKYGDITTDKYNVNPYGTAAYETNGNFFAWLGTLGDEGRIDFLGGGLHIALLSSAPVTGNMNLFNFYYTKMQGAASSNPHVLPANLTRVAPFGDAFCILHTSTFGRFGSKQGDAYRNG